MMTDRALHFSSHNYTVCPTLPDMACYYSNSAYVIHNMAIAWYEVP